ncbi:hypothetical protein GTP46_11335 [Duganella sp. FT135W]|uniref:DUF2026 domain-containing protein n=1 Tax=Duganella flavida TaxID=2692175 RepID=A0A6L8K6V1_9BURK|nr:hypothetical protein [Duganella flavida]MYM23239.1 hypothetical protein [Duganella flavida]
MRLSVKALIAECVNAVVRKHYPGQYYSLCHVYAIVGSNLISIVNGHNFRPVAGLAAVDCGDGQLMLMADNSAFSCKEGGAFHCWIESVDDADSERQIVDLTFRHNHTYAEKNGFAWTLAPPPAFLWGLRSNIVLDATLERLPKNFPEGRVWLSETDAGAAWMTQQLLDHQNAFVVLTAEALTLFSHELLSSESNFNEI